MVNNHCCISAYNSHCLSSSSFVNSGRWNKLFKVCNRHSWCRCRSWYRLLRSLILMQAENEESLLTQCVLFFNYKLNQPLQHFQFDCDRAHFHTNRLQCCRPIANKEQQARASRSHPSGQRRQKSQKLNNAADEFFVPSCCVGTDSRNAATAVQSEASDGRVRGRSHGWTAGRPMAGRRCIARSRRRISLHPATH